MICYRDMTFCDFAKTCSKASKCPRALTDEVKKQAKEWWETFKIEGEPPICVFVDKPSCYEEIKNEKG